MYDRNRSPQNLGPGGTWGGLADPPLRACSSLTPLVLGGPFPALPTRSLRPTVRRLPPRTATPPAEAMEVRIDAPTVSLFVAVEGADTINDIMGRLAAMGQDVQTHDLWHRLDGNRMASERGVNSSSEVRLLRRGPWPLHVRIGAGRTITLEVETSFTIDKVKTAIFDQAGFLPSDQRLVLQGRVLESGCTLGDCDVRPDATIVVHKQHQIYIRKWSGRIITLDVQDTETIESVKSRIQLLDGISPNRQHLLFDGRELQDDFTLRRCGVRRYAQLVLREL